MGVTNYLLTGMILQVDAPKMAQWQLAHLHHEAIVRHRHIGEAAAIILQIALKQWAVSCLLETYEIVNLRSCPWNFGINNSNILSETTR